MDICKTSLNWGVFNRLRGHSHVTNCKYKTNYAQVRVIFKSLIRLDRVDTNQSGGFVSFWVKIAFKNLFIFEKET